MTAAIRYVRSCKASFFKLVLNAPIRGMSGVSAGPPSAWQIRQKEKYPEFVENIFGINIPHGQAASSNGG